MLLDERPAQSLYQQPVDPFATSGLIRTYAELDGPLEFTGDFLRQLQKELSQRLMLVKSGIDEHTAMDQFIFRILKDGNMRLLQD